jgi:predicted nucleotidyltransferase
MVSLDTLSIWLRRSLAVDFVSEAWIFGSALDTDRQPNDIDIFVKYLDKHSKQIPDWRRKVQGEFLACFALPLHMLTLTQSESIEVESFLESSLKGALRVR